MATLNGRKDTAQKLVQMIVLKKGLKEEDVREEVSERTLMKYKVMRIRHKISFTAFVKRMTVMQLLLISIMKAHEDLVREGSIPLYDSMLDQKL